MAPGATRASDDASVVRPVEPLARERSAPLEPVTMFPELTLRAPAVIAPPTTHLLAPHRLAPPVELSLHFVRLAVHGDGQAGLSTFVGTSTASLGGFRLRF
jgi:hypothetical protein